MHRILRRACLWGTLVLAGCGDAASNSGGSGGSGGIGGIGGTGGTGGMAGTGGSGGQDAPVPDGPITDASPNDASPMDAPPIDSSPMDDAAQACSGGSECVPVAPSGWTGPYELYDGPSPAPACGSAYSATPFYMGFDGLVAPPANCSCSCGAPTGVTCSDATLSMYRNTSCPAPACASVVVPPASCTPVSPNTCGVFMVHLASTGSSPQGGSCAPGAVTTTIPPATWNQVAQGCTQATTPTQGACASGLLCAPRPDPGYHICITSNFNVPCPSGPYSTRRLTYQSESDLRACSACSCGAVTGANCNGSLYLYSVPGCNGGTSVFVPQTSCSPPANLPPQVFAYLFTSLTGGACAGTSTPIGSVTPTQPTTFCCID